MGESELPPAGGRLIAARYRIEATLGRGGMGAVYRVRDERDGRALALKRLIAPAGAPRSLLLSSFEREYHALSQLAHPRIVEVYDYGIDADGAYYTMELLDGHDLRELGKLSWRRVCLVLRDVASSLAILHSRRLLHRDVSPRNVRCTEDGRAKLLDFGAMVPMGVAKDVVGTPPLLPPEALQRLALDGRADLYALGGLAYWALTGRYPYPVRRAAELRDAWRTPPQPPHRLSPAVPQELSQLVMELLNLDRNARPASAAEVIERLAPLAGTSSSDRPAVSLAYFTTPRLVGRDAALETARGRLLQSLRGHGGTLLFAGEAGLGRSRILDAFVLEAKLLGMSVLRADASDAARGDYAVVRKLATQLLDASPECARSAAAPHAAVLAGLIDAPAEPRESARPVATAAPRQQAHVALRDWFLAVARDEPVAIAIDDPEAMDAGSIAVVSALAYRAPRRRLALALACDPPREAAPGLSLLRELASEVPLAPLQAAETAQLVRSLFGDVPNVTVVAARVHDLSQGNPRAIMELAQHLVEQRVVRYEAGQWLLPEHLPRERLPHSLDGARAARIAALSEDARELGQLLSLSRRGLTAAELVELAGHRDPARVYRALDGLVAADMLAPSDDVQRLKHEAWQLLFTRDLPAERLRALYGRLAELAQTAGDRQLVPYYLMRAAEERRAIDWLLQHGGDAFLARSADNIRLLEGAADAADRLGLPTVVGLELRSWLVGIASVVGNHESFARYGPVVLRQLRQDAGLSDWDALASAGLSPDARLHEALARAQRRHDRLPERERGFAPADAIARLGRSCAGFASMVALSLDGSLLDEVPSLEPLLPLSPALGSVELLISCMRHFNAAQWDLCRADCQALLSRIGEHPEGSGLEPSYHIAMRLGMRYILGIMDASQGKPDAARWVGELESTRGYRANAWRVHMMMHLVRGDSDAAAQAAHRAELLRLQDGEATYPGSSARVEAFVHWMADDLMNIKTAIENLSKIAQRFPSFRPVLHVARCHYHRLRSEPLAALEQVEQALRTTAPGAHPDWPWVAQAHVQTLLALGRDEEAVQHGAEYYRLCVAHACHPVDHTLRQLLSEALSRTGRLEEAVAHADAALEAMREAQSEGLLLGAAHESRARVALRQGDAPAFHEHAARCAEEYRRGGNRALIAKYERLLQDAAAAGFGVASELHRATEPGVARVGVASGAGQALHSQLLECANADERARYALGRLLECAGASEGILYATRNGQWRPIASLPCGTGELLGEALRPQLEEHIARERGREELTMTVGLVPNDASGTQPLAHDLRHGDRSYRPLLLVTRRDGETVLAAVAALRVDDRRHLRLDPELQAAVAAALVEHDDVDPLTCVS